MPIIEFGSGLLYGTPTSGNLPTNPTPFRLLLQEVSIDFKGDLKKLHTLYQLPISVARGKLDVTGKAKIVDFQPALINQLFWAQTSTVGMEIPVFNELDFIPSTSTFTITVTNGATFAQDHGVVYATGVNAGQSLLANTTAGAAGYYSVNVTSGVYTFASTDSARAVYIDYTYTNATRGQTLAISAQLMGYAPVCTMDVWGTFRGKYLGIRLNACTLGSWTYPTKLEDYWMSDVNFDANLDASQNLGKVFGDNF